MNKEELIELLESLKIDKEEYWILSTSSLLLRGLFDKANDLDIAVTKKGLEQLQESYDLKPNGNNWYIVNELVECVLDVKTEENTEKYGEYYLQSLTNYYNFLKDSTREKDKVKLKIVKKELGIK